MDRQSRHDDRWGHHGARSVCRFIEGCAGPVSVLLGAYELCGSRRAGTRLSRPQSFRDRATLGRNVARKLVPFCAAQDLQWDVTSFAVGLTVHTV